MFEFLDSYFNDRKSLSDEENGKYYFGLLAEAVNSQLGTHYQSWDMMDKVRENDNRKIDYYENLGFYCRVIDFNASTIFDAFNRCALQFGDRMNLANINTCLNGEASDVSQFGESVIAGAVAVDTAIGDVTDYAIDKTKSGVKNIVDGAGTLFNSAVQGASDTFKNLPWLVPLALTVVGVLGVAYLVSKLRGKK